MEMAREELYQRVFQNLAEYDYHILDCAPSLSMLTINALFYVDEVFIPVSMEVLALAGAHQFMSYFAPIEPNIRLRCYHSFVYSHHVRCQTPCFARQILKKLQHDFGNKVTHAYSLRLLPFRSTWGW